MDADVVIIQRIRMIPSLTATWAWWIRAVDSLCRLSTRTHLKPFSFRIQWYSPPSLQTEYFAEQV